MADTVYLLGVETNYDQEADPQYRCTLHAQVVATGDVVTYSGGCPGAPDECIEDLALEAEWEIIDRT